MSTLSIGPSVAHPQPGLCTIEINGRLYDVAKWQEPNGETMWRGDLHGEDTETGQPWDMTFWLPDAAVAEMRADAGAHTKCQESAVPA